MDKEFREKLIDFFDCFLSYVGPIGYQDCYDKILGSWHTDPIPKPSKEEVVEKFTNILDYGD